MPSSSEPPSENTAKRAGYRAEKQFTESDRRLLETYEPLIDALAAFGGKGCEVALHSFEDPQQSVVRIVNGHVTGRSPGSPMTDLGTRLIQKGRDMPSETYWTYFTRTAGGHPIKSLSSIIRNPRGRAIGMLCINIDLNTPLSDLIAGFIPGDESPMKDPPEHFVMSADELVERSVAEVVDAISTDRGVSNATKNKEIVAELYARGIFDIKGAIDMVSRELGVSRYTIYNYIREVK